MPQEFPLIAVVDDDESMREAVKSLLRSVGYDVTTFGSANDFIKSHHRSRVRCLVADINMPGMSGLELHRNLLASGNDIPTVLITAYGDESTRERALASGVSGYLKKPFREEELLCCIRSALKRPTAPIDSRG